MKNKNERIYSVTQTLPNDGEKCLCFGNKTLCCQKNMEEDPEWHEVTFRFFISTYKVKKNIPEDPEESILENYTITEGWEIGPEFDDGRVFGVTQWSKIE